MPELDRTISDSPPTGRRKIPLQLHTAGDGTLGSAVGPGAGLQFVATVFPTAKQIIRIASAYFSLPGYRLAREYIGPDVLMNVLVGREDGPRLQSAVIEEILYDLARAETDLWEAVKDLVDRMRNGLFRIRDARQINTRFHCKFYICDDHSLWHGSANYTKQGLNGNAEQASVSRDTLEVQRFNSWYDVAEDAIDLLEPLLERLEQWLQLAQPFDVYLAALYHLYDMAVVDLGPEGHAPLYYQRAVVRSALQHLEQYRGAIAVVATGLGKTVIGADVAFRMYSAGHINRVILVAPRSVHRDWSLQLGSRRILADTFTPETLFRSVGHGPAPQHHRD